MLWDCDNCTGLSEAPERGRNGTKEREGKEQCGGEAERATAEIALGGRESESPHTLFAIRAPNAPGVEKIAAATPSTLTQSGSRHLTAFVSVETLHAMVLALNFVSPHTCARSCLIRYV